MIENRLKQIGIILFFFIAFGVVDSFAESESTKKKLSIRWQKVKDADYYEIMLYLSANPSNRIVFRSTNESLEKMIPESFDTLKIRSVKTKNYSKIYSKWSDVVGIPKALQKPDTQAENKSKNDEKNTAKDDSVSEQENKPKKKYARYLYPRTRLFILPSFSFRNGYWINKKTVIELKTESKISKDNTLYYSLTKKKEKENFRVLKGKKIPKSDFQNKEGEYELAFYSVDQYGNKGRKQTVFLIIDTISPRVKLIKKDEYVLIKIQDVSSVNGKITSSDKKIKTIYQSGSYKIKKEKLAGDIRVEVKDATGNFTVRDFTP